MLKFVCDKCGEIVSYWEGFRRVEVSTLTGEPDMGTVPGNLLELDTTIDLCEKCYKKLGLE